jgi:hypothetical protein
MTNFKFLLPQSSSVAYWKFFRSVAESAYQVVQFHLNIEALGFDLSVAEDIGPNYSNSC